MTAAELPGIHRWTHTGDKVLCVKMIGADRKTGGQKLDEGGNAPVIQWPKSGLVKCVDWNDKATCGGGIHAWPWGMFIGDGRDPNACVPWLVVAVDPAEIVQIEGGKVKFAKCKVVYDGDMAGAMYMTSQGRIAWTMQHVDIKKFTDRAANGQSGYMAANGQSGDMAANGQSGDRAANGQSGDMAANGQSGDMAANGQSGYRAANGQSGDGAANGQSGYGAANGQSGYGAANGQSGDMATSKQTGILSASAMTGASPTVELGPTGSAAVSGAEEFTWIVHLGAIVLHRWQEGSEYPHAVLTTAGLKEGETVVIYRGKVKE